MNRFRTLPPILLAIFANAARGDDRTEFPVQKIVEIKQTKTVTTDDGKLETRVVSVAVAQTVKMTAAPDRCAIVVCDMWDNHWCEAAAKRCDVLANTAAPVIAAARKSGLTIIHCPSDTMEFYKGSAARKRAQAAAKADPSKEKMIEAPALPIDDRDGGCDDAAPVKPFKAWTRQHKAIAIDEETDFVSDNGREVYNVLRANKIEVVFVLGVHTNMCVLNRGFAIKQLRKWDVECVLVRNLTDAMYNPTQRPKVTHDEGTQLVIRHIEQYWCPSVLAKDLPGAK